MEFKEFKVQNVVASTDVQFPIRLEGLVAAHRNFATYPLRRMIVTFNKTLHFALVYGRLRAYLPSSMGLLLRRCFSETATSQSCSRV